MSKKVLVFALTIALAATLVGGATMAWFTDSDASDPAEFTAGTLLVEANTSMIYGVEYKDPENQAGSLYEIFVDRDNNTVSYGKLFDSSKKALNALAYDRKNKRLYYADGNGYLYFYDVAKGTGDHSAGRVTNGKLFNAAFGMGCYWFIEENAPDLYKVSFNSDGTIKDIILEAENFAGKQYGFGDIAIDMRDGIIYGSTASGPKEYFTYDVRTGEYKEFSNGAANMQLAFGADGVLYGTVTRERGWYVIDKTDGSAEFFAECDKMFGDLASNHQDNWNPGDSDIIRYYARNVGTKNQYVRVRVDGEWLEDGLDNNLVSFRLCDGSANDWVWHDGYFYYKKVLPPGEEALLCVIVDLNGPATDNEYQGKTFDISAKVEAIQATNGASQEVWGWSPGTS